MTARAKYVQSQADRLATQRREISHVWDRVRLVFWTINGRTYWEYAVVGEDNRPTPRAWPKGAKLGP